MRNLLLLTAALALAPQAFAACPDPLPANTLCIEWQAPTENVDGSPLTDLAGYKLYYDTNPILPGFGTEIDIPNPLATELNLVTDTLNLTAPPGGGVVDLYIRMTAYDQSGNESILSNQVIEAVTFPDNQPPAPPSVLRAIININVN